MIGHILGFPCAWSRQQKRRSRRHLSHDAGCPGAPAFSFYSEKEFDLSRIKKLDGELLELGGMPTLENR
jgi:hypothetical protein